MAALSLLLRAGPDDNVELIFETCLFEDQEDDYVGTMGFITYRDTLNHHTYSVTQFEVNGDDDEEIDLSELHVCNVKEIGGRLPALRLLSEKLIHSLYISEVTLGRPQMPPCISSLHQLEILDLHEIPDMVHLPDDIFLAPSLLELNIAECAQLKEISDVPEQGDVCKLQKLSATQCPRLRRLPDNIGAFRASLTVLCASMCTLRTLPDSLCDLHHLQRLDISNNLLEQLPARIHELRQLIYLNILSNSPSMKHHEFVTEIYLRRMRRRLQADTQTL